MKDKLLDFLNSGNELSSGDKIVIIAMLLIIIFGNLYIKANTPDDRPGGIIREFRDKGYDVDNIDFEFVENSKRKNVWVFQSSEPIYYGKEYVSQWLITRNVSAIHTGQIPNIFYTYIVEPYLPPEV